jgi:hypothetical protein
MTAIINGDSPSITFSDSTTQATSAVVSGKVPKSLLPTGSVLQVVNATSTTSVSTTSTSLVTTNFSASITPTSSSSKIFILINARCNTGAAGNNTSFAIYRGATNLTGSTGYAIFSSGSNISPMTTLSWLDSPSTTSSTTYTLYFASSSGTSIGLQGNGSADFPAVITLMEIAA